MLEVDLKNLSKNEPSAKWKKKNKHVKTRGKKRRITRMEKRKQQKGKENQYSEHVKNKTKEHIF